MLSLRQRQVMKRHEEGSSFETIARELGIKPATVKGHYFAAQRRDSDEAKNIAALGPDDDLPPNAHELADKCDRKAARILTAMDDDSIARAPLNQKAYAFAALIDKGRLLRGEATQIISHDDRRSMKDLLPILLPEAKRRNMLNDVLGDIIEGECEAVG